MPSQAPQPIKPTTPTPEAKLVYRLRDQYSFDLYKRALDHFSQTYLQMAHPEFYSEDKDVKPLSQQEIADFMSRLLDELSCSRCDYTGAFSGYSENDEVVYTLQKKASDYVTAIDTILHCDEMKDPEIFSKVDFSKRSMRLFAKLLNIVYDDNAITDMTRTRAWDCMDTLRKIAHAKGKTVPLEIDAWIMRYADTKGSFNQDRALGHMRIVQTLRAQGQPAPTPAVS